jgi:heptosyltransferase-1
MKALVVELSSLGDVVHALPMLPVLSRRGWEVGWLAEHPASALLEKHPLVARLIPASMGGSFGLRSRRQAVRALRAERFEAALDLQGRWKSAVWARLSRASRVIGHASAWRREPLSSILIREPIDVPEAAHHVIDRNLSLLRVLGMDAVGYREFPLAPSDAARPEVDAFLALKGIEDFVLLHPGGEAPGRLWSAQGFGEVARGLKDRGFACLVTWGQGEEPLAQRVVAASEGAALACPPTNLHAFMEIARRAQVLVAADVGPLHLACAMGVPVVAIYGPTDPARNGPFDSRDVVVRSTPLCSPCYKRRCPIHEGVMDATRPADVLRAIERRLGVPAGHRGLAV